MSVLQIFRGDDFLEEVALSREVTGLGRHPKNEVVLDDKSLSRFHARVERRGSRFVVVDCGAQNGVQLNGERVDGESALSPGDRIVLGRYVAIFSAGADAFDEEEPPPPPPPQPRREPGRVPSPTARPTPAPEPVVAESLSRRTPATRKAPVPALVVLMDNVEVARHVLTEQLVVGRSKQADIVISRMGLSRTHARITRSKEGVFVEDLGSQNGTWVNGVQIEGKQTLADGDIINFYDHAVVFLTDGTASLPRSEEAQLPSRTDLLVPQETQRLEEPDLSPQSVSPSQAIELDDAELDEPPPPPSVGDPFDGLGEGSVLDSGFGDKTGERARRSAASELLSSDGAPAKQRAFDPLDDDEIERELAMLDEIERDILRREPERSKGATAIIDGSSGRAAAGAPATKGRDYTDEPFEGLGNGTAELRGPLHSDRTSAGNISGNAWPQDSDLVEALSLASDVILVTLEVTLGGKPYTQMPLTQTVTRVGTHPQCELSLPRSSGLAPWHITLILLGGSVVMYRGARGAHIVHAEEETDMAVLRDGDLVDLGKVSIKLRVR